MTRGPLPNRKFIRLDNYDYSQPGAYFVTICVQNRKHLLGHIVQGELRLSSFGETAVAKWKWLATHYSYVQLDEYVVMPNHMHALLWITGSADLSDQPANKETKRKPLGGLIGAFKTVSTKAINLVRNTPGEQFWQRDFYEHIVRDDEALLQIRRYIIENPKRWSMDVYNPNAISRDPWAAEIWQRLQ